MAGKIITSVEDSAITPTVNVFFSTMLLAGHYSLTKMAISVLSGIASTAQFTNSLRFPYNAIKTGEMVILKGCASLFNSTLPLET